MTKEELLTQESLKELLIYDTSTGEFVWTKQIPGRRKRKVGTIRPDGYVMIHIVGKFYLAHRLAWLYINGEWPEGEIDHIDRNPSNNAFANLRDTTHSENMQNLADALRTNKTGILGVCCHKRSGKFHAQIVINGKKKHLGLFTTKEEASSAYHSAKLSLHTHTPPVHELQKEDIGGQS